MQQPKMPVESLRKGLEILEMLCEAPQSEGLALADIARRMGLKRTTTHNLAKTLRMCGFAQTIGEGRYKSGWRTAHIGRLALFTGQTGTAILTIAAQASAEMNEAIVVTTLVRGRRRVLARTDGNQLIRVDVAALQADEKSMWTMVTGRVLAAFCCADELEHVISEEGIPGEHWPDVARAGQLDSALAAIRARGYAEHEEQHQVASIAVPVLTADGQLLGAIGTHLPVFRFTADRKQLLLETLRRMAQRLAQHMKQT